MRALNMNTYYLVAPIGLHDQTQTEGSLGFLSDGTERPKGAQSCSVRDIGECP